MTEKQILGPSTDFSRTLKVQKDFLGFKTGSNSYRCIFPPHLSHLLESSNHHHHISNSFVCFIKYWNKSIIYRTATYNDDYIIKLNNTFFSWLFSFLLTIHIYTKNNFYTRPTQIIQHENTHDMCCYKIFIRTTTPTHFIEFL